MRILDIARDWIYYRGISSDFWAHDGRWLPAESAFIESEIAKAEVLRRLAALQVSA